MTQLGTITPTSVPDSRCALTRCVLCVAQAYHSGGTSVTDKVRAICEVLSGTGENWEDRVKALQAVQVGTTLPPPRVASARGETVTGLPNARRCAVLWQCKGVCNAAISVHVAGCWVGCSNSGSLVPGCTGGSGF